MRLILRGGHGLGFVLIGERDGAEPRDGECVWIILFDPCSHLLADEAAKVEAGA